MAKRIRSGLKRLRQTAKRTAHNQAVRSRLRTLVKRAGEGAQDLPSAIKAIDKAAAAGIIHKNAAARRKSRLIRRQRAAASS